MKGLFELTSSDELFAKLKADREALRTSPLDSHLAFNFVVTAWHLREWRFPDPADQAEVCRRHPVLRVCEHLAIGAKHFEPGPRHKTVTSTGRTGVWAKGFWAPGFWKSGVWAESLVIRLSGDAPAEFGESTTVTELADRVMQAWAAEFCE